MTRCKATNKLRYVNHDRAIAGATGIMARGLDLGHRPLNVYRCDVCGDWHIGHRPTVFAAQPPVTQEPPKPLRCWCACPKPATELVDTPGGTLAVCAHHAKRLRDAYATCDGRAGMRP